MDPKRHYTAEPRLGDKPAPKNKVAPSITDNVNYAAAATILRRLENGLGAIEAETDALRIEHHLGDALSRRNKLSTRDVILKARLDKHRAKVPADKALESVTGKLPASVTTALEIIGTWESREPRSRPATRVNRRELIKQLESDLDEVRAAIIEQHAIVDELRNELSGDIARRLQPDHKKLVLAQYRAAQAFAAATDCEAEFRLSVINAGYTWRHDLLAGPQLRGALVLGSEATFDSDISRARRALEALEIL